MTSAAVRATMPVGQWNALAYLSRAGKPVNCGVLIAVCGTSFENLQSLAEGPSLVSLHQAGSGSDDAPPRWLTSPAQTEVRLTLAGRPVAGQIVDMAGTLLFLGRQSRPTLTEKLHEISGISRDLLDVLFEHNMVEPVHATGDPGPRATARYLRITSKGRRYTTENPS